MSYPKQANKHTHTSTLLYTTCYHSHTMSHISCMHHIAYSHPTYNMCCIHTYPSHPITTYSQHTLHHIHSKHSHISFITFVTCIIFITFIAFIILTCVIMLTCSYLLHHQNTICSNAWLYSYACSCSFICYRHLKHISKHPQNLINVSKHSQKHKHAPEKQTKKRKQKNKVMWDACICNLA